MDRGAGDGFLVLRQTGTLRRMIRQSRVHGGSHPGILCSFPPESGGQPNR